jgi:ADP-heptose:LPS heptosyltransferase
MNSWRLDCRYFLGDRPCRFKRLCEGCPDYSPMGKRILIVKLAAIGDVLRTTPLLSGLKRAYPRSHITWVVDKEALPLLKNNPWIDRLLSFDFSALLPLEFEAFDLILGLEKEARGAALVSKIKAPEKRGFGLGKNGNIFPLNPASEYAFFLGLADDLKFYRNEKTYPQLIFEMAEIEYRRDEYLLFLGEEDAAFAGRFAKKAKLRKGETLIGLNTGAGDVFANKAWTLEGYVKLIRALKKRGKTRLLLLGGPQERDRNRKILQKVGGAAIDGRCDNTLGQFAALINRCDLVVTGDTTALHLAIGLKKNVVALFGPTCPQEIELYGRGKKIVSSLSCAPCYRRTCAQSPNCMEAVSVGEVLENINNLIDHPQRTKRF